MNGVPNARATSRHASAARTSDPRTAGSFTLPQQKLSRMAVRFGSAPTATAFRTASSIAAAAIQYGSRSPYRGLIPLAMASPCQEPRTGLTTAASDGPSLWTPVSGLMTLPPWTSWSYWRTTHSLDATVYDARIDLRTSPDRPAAPASAALTPSVTAGGSPYSAFLGTS